MMGMKYSFDARPELARRSSAIFQRSAPAVQSRSGGLQSFARVLSCVMFGWTDAGLVQRLQPLVFLDCQHDDNGAPMLRYRDRLGSGEIDQPSEAVLRVFRSQDLHLTLR